MENNELQFWLNGIQYGTIIFSGILGILGLMFNFKNKETGKLTKSGTYAMCLLVLSLFMGITSKTLDLNLKRMAGESEAKRARIASEQSLKIAQNVDRIVNAIHDVSLSAEFYTNWDSPLFKVFKTKIEEKVNVDWNDKDYSPNELAALIPDVRWQKIVREMLFVSPEIRIYPKGSSIPNCINDEENAPLEFSFPFQIDNIECPQQSNSFWIEYDGKADFTPMDSSQILSLIDFKGATIIGYMFQSIKTEIPKIDTINQLNINLVDFEVQFPSTTWKFNSFGFMFDGGRSLSIQSFEIKYDKCTAQPYFIAKIDD